MISLGPRISFVSILCLLLRIVDLRYTILPMVVNLFEMIDLLLLVLG
jgi:hypothetical protein